MIRLWHLLVLCATLIGAPPTHAHKPSDAYITLQRDGSHITGRWDIAIRDLDTALDLDRDGDGAISWGELRSQRGAIETYARSRLELRSGGEPCTVTTPGLLVDAHVDGTYAVLTIDARCSVAGPTLSIDYRLLFDVDPQHHGLLQYVEGGVSRSLVLSNDAPRLVVGADRMPAMTQFAAYLHEGIWHIWLGFDHVLFLLSLLLPAVWRFDGHGWRPHESLRGAVTDVAKIVTAFTVAHSITLSLAVLGFLQLPSRWVESAIALSVLLAALNNVWPVVRNGRWAAAFAFGLVHGVGFAGALRDLGLPTGSLALSLVGFNVGVEVGQLAIVAVLLPFAYAARATGLYRRVAFVGGSVVIAVIAAGWLVERALDVQVFARLAELQREFTPAR